MNSGGGTVTGYGLAAAQLTRFRDAGVKLTICVEQVAASGGYMMACVADRLVASPFAVLGSIGVITEQVAPPFALAVEYAVLLLLLLFLLLTAPMDGRGVRCRPHR